MPPGRIASKVHIQQLKDEIKALKEQHRLEIKETILRTQKEDAIIWRKKVIAGKRLVKKQSWPLLLARVKKARRIAKAKVEGKALILTDNRIDRVYVRSAVYIDGVLAYPVITSYAKENGLSAGDMCMLILANIVKECRSADLEIYGFHRHKAHLQLSKLAELGWVEKFGDGYIPLFTPSIKGRKLFLGFRTYYKKLIKQGIFNEDGEVKRHKWFDE